MSSQTWTIRELPVLRVLVGYFDDPGSVSIHPAKIAELCGLTEDEVNRANLALHGASPAYIEGITVAEFAYPIKITGVTERARRAVGQWPESEALAQRLIDELRSAAEHEPNEEKRTKLRKAAEAVTEIGVKVMAEVLAKLAGGAV